VLGRCFPLPKSKCSTLELFRSWIIKRERNNPSDIRCSCHLSVRYAGLATVPPPRGRHSHRCCEPFSSAIRLVIMLSLVLRGPLRQCCEFESRCCFFSQRSFLTRCCLLSKRSQLKATTGTHINLNLTTSHKPSTNANSTMQRLSIPIVSP